MSDDELKEKYPSMFARSSIGFDFYEGLMQHVPMCFAGEAKK
jgi:hypothetical protein